MWMWMWRCGCGCCPVSSLVKQPGDSGSVNGWASTPIFKSSSMVEKSDSINSFYIISMRDFFETIELETRRDVVIIHASSNYFKTFQLTHFIHNYFSLRRVIFILNILYYNYINITYINRCIIKGKLFLTTNNF